MGGLFSQGTVSYNYNKPYFNLFLLFQSERCWRYVNNVIGHLGDDDNHGDYDGVAQSSHWGEKDQAGERKKTVISNTIFRKYL